MSTHQKCIWLLDSVYVLIKRVWKGERGIVYGKCMHMVYYVGILCMASDVMVFVASPMVFRCIAGMYSVLTHVTINNIIYNELKCLVKSRLIGNQSPYFNIHM